MPHYRFVLTSSGQEQDRAEEYGIFNDEGALQFARRFGHNAPVEIWEQQRLVGRIEPAQPALAD
jgi:hypothetical protein